MAFGELVGELKGKITSVKVLPFDGSGVVRQEANWSAEWSGRIRGTEVGTTHSLTAPDGTGTSKAYGVITTSDGDVITGEAFHVNSPTANGLKIRGIGYWRTSSQKYAWVNTTPTAFEGEVNATQEFSLTLWEWK
jgi:hypothetical protein